MIPGLLSRWAGEVGCRLHPAQKPLHVGSDIPRAALIIFDSTGTEEATGFKGIGGKPAERESR